MISELNTIQGGVASPYLSSSLPFCLHFNVELQRGRLISTLQNSIQGLGLRVTLAGPTPLVLKSFQVRTWIALFVDFITGDIGV